MEKILLIDTADREKTVVGLKIGGETHFLKGKRISSQILLPLIDKILKKYQLKLHDLTGIRINLGPGSYTGLRVGAAVANTLGVFLKIPVNGQKIGQTVAPFYDNRFQYLTRKK